MSELLAKIENIQGQIKNLDQESDLAFAKQRALHDRKFSLCVEYVLKEKLLNKCKWTIESRHKPNFVLIGDTDEIHSYTRSLLFKGMYHETVELQSGINLRFDDGDVRLVFTSIENMRDFLSEQDIKVDASPLVQMKIEIEKELKLITEFMEVIQQ